MSARDERAENRAHERAWFLLVAGLTPVQYARLTMRERNAIVELHEEMNR